MEAGIHHAPCRTSAGTWDLSLIHICKKTKAQTAVGGTAKGFPEQVRRRFSRAGGDACAFFFWKRLGYHRRHGNEQQRRHRQKPDRTGQAMSGDGRLDRRRKDADADADARSDKAG